MARCPRLPVSAHLFAAFPATLLLVTSGGGSSAIARIEPNSVRDMRCAANRAEHTSNRDDLTVAFVLNAEGHSNVFVAEVAEFVGYDAILYIRGGSPNRAIAN
jgi:hypothetical protein